MGVPLITAVLGEHAVFYTAGMVALLNVFQWTYEQRLLLIPLLTIGLLTLLPEQWLGIRSAMLVPAIFYPPTTCARTQLVI